VSSPRIKRSFLFAHQTISPLILFPIGKPHPPWADTAFRNGHPSDKWHSRTSKSSSSKHRRASLSSPETRHPLLSGPIKAEDMTLYRISPSPDHSVRYGHNHYPSDSQTFENGAGPAIAHGHKSSYSTESTGSSALSYDTSSSIPYLHSHHQPHPPPPPHPHSASYSEGCYPLDPPPTHDDDSSYFTTDEGSSVGTTATYGCACRANPSIAHALAGLSTPLQAAIAGLRQYTPRRDGGGGGGGHDCRVYRRVLQLHDLLQCPPPHPPSSSAAPSHVLALSFSSSGGSDSGCESAGSTSNVSAGGAAPSPTANGMTNHTTTTTTAAAVASNHRHPNLTFEPLPRPTENEIMASLSASNSPYHSAPHPPTSSAGHSPHEWNTLGVETYGSYFPMQTTEHPGYNMS
jgi:hypothetical protein